MQPRWFDESEIRSRIDMPGAIAAMRSAFVQLSSGAADVPVRTAVDGAGTTALFMPGWLPDEGTLGAKVVTVRAANAGSARPVVQAVVLLVDPDTGAPAALLDGTWLTALRTGAASGLATDLLARPEAEVLAVVGAGGQARAQIEAVLAVRPIRDVRIRSRAGRSAERLVRELSTDGVTFARPDGVRGTPRFAVEMDPDRQVDGADVIVTATDAVDPVLPARLPDGVHVNAVGAWTPGMCEVPPEVVARSRVFVDERAAARQEAGDLVRAVELGVFGWNDVIGEIGELAAGRVRGRTSPSDVTLFKSVGSAAQDLAVARAVWDGTSRGGDAGGA